MSDQKKTHFAPAERATEAELKQDIEFLSGFPVITELLHLESGLLGVLNDKRQFVATNKHVLSALVGAESGDALGMRPGEAANCIYSDVHEGGCGTSEMCSTCGAAIAIVGSLESNDPIERNCSLVVRRGNKKDDVFLRVLSCPINIKGRKFILLFAQDISYQQKWAVLEKVFLHDVSNVLTGMLLALELLRGCRLDGEAFSLAEDVRQMASQMAREIEIQKILTGAEGLIYKPIKTETSGAVLLDDIKKILSTHPSAHGKTLKFPGDIPEARFEADTFLMKKVLGNMLINALEASDNGEEVKVEFDVSENEIEFSVWNKKPIPELIRNRVFQRNFTTKSGMGRGLGTYSMKLFGEEFLGGKVSFTTCEKQGTVFKFCIRK